MGMAVAEADPWRGVRTHCDTCAGVCGHCDMRADAHQIALAQCLEGMTRLYPGAYPGSSLLRAPLSERSWDPKTDSACPPEFHDFNTISRICKC